jgi:hypothetical protein
MEHRELRENEWQRRVGFMAAEVETLQAASSLARSRQRLYEEVLIRESV